MSEWENVPGLDMGRQYNNAPIFEAIIELQVSTPEELSLDGLAALDFGTGYGTPEPVYNLNFAIDGDLEVGGSIPTETRKNQVGFALSRVDKQRTVQYGAQRFAFTWRTNYTHWAEFIAEVESAWLLYRQAAEPLTVTNVGVRFVNQIPMPARSLEIKDYLRTSVDIPAHLPQVLSSLFMQVTIPLPKQEAQATITSAILPSDDEHPGGGLLLDIDVQSPVAISTVQDDFDASLRTTLGRLRLAKNFVFEACITDATRGLID